MIHLVELLDKNVDLKDEYTKICLNKNINCDNPPCWHDVSTSQCNDLLRDDAEDTSCAPESLKDFRGNEILDEWKSYFCFTKL